MKWMKTCVWQCRWKRGRELGNCQGSSPGSQQGERWGLGGTWGEGIKRNPLEQPSKSRELAEQSERGKRAWRNVAVGYEATSLNIPRWKLGHTRSFLTWKLLLSLSLFSSDSKRHRQQRGGILRGESGCTHHKSHVMTGQWAAALAQLQACDCLNLGPVSWVRPQAQRKGSPREKGPRSSVKMTSYSRNRAFPLPRLFFFLRSRIDGQGWSNHPGPWSKGQENLRHLSTDQFWTEYWATELTQGPLLWDFL